MTLLSRTDSLFFTAINGLPHSNVSDSIALLLSGAGGGGVVWIVIGAILVFREEHRHRKFFVSLGVAVSAAWLLSDWLLKPLFQRMRPSPLDGALIIGGGVPGYSFPSSHAVIAWACAVVISHTEPALRPLCFLLAALISLSRVYLGVHFPGDILAGSILGWSIGILVISVFGKRVRGRGAT